jgi:Fe-S-cluster containining protein
MTHPADPPEPDAARPRDVLRALYADLDAEVSRRGASCALSGRCCRFAEYGHTLFLTAAEAALLLDEAPPPSRPLDDGETCPWQDARGRCTARDARPLGCRVYFCDPAFQAQAPELSEAYIARLRRLADEFGLPWQYAPLHDHLRQARDDGRFPPPGRSTRGRIADVLSD